mmetsp:Transcript_39582/g.59843  ORF Transcript_39582/g.59843 Transcript_39582/m.59843 type:complete len:83 (-) Transcript_39582:649-897(-)
MPTETCKVTAGSSALGGSPCTKSMRQAQYKTVSKGCSTMALMWPKKRGSLHQSIRVQIHNVDGTLGARCSVADMALVQNTPL